MEDILTNATFIEILKVVVPVIMTGIITFLVAIYNYNKNIPLDKLEIAYNRIYYPIYCLITSDIDIPQIVKKCEWYLKKYRKYADRSTLKAFKYLDDNYNSWYGKKAYTNFKNNIDKMHTALRRKLGYLEPNVFNMYASSAPSEKRVVRLFLELSGIYLSAIIASQIQSETVDDMYFIIFSIAFIALCVDIIGAIFQAILKGIVSITVKCKK